MVDWGIRARTWTAKSPHEQRLEHETHRLQTHQDRLHREIKSEQRMLDQVEDIAADANYDARHAYRDARYGYGSPYHRNPYVASPYLGGRNMVGHPNLLMPGQLGVGISPHLDPAYALGTMQARREMAIVQQRRRRMLAERQILVERQRRQDLGEFIAYSTATTPNLPVFRTPHIVPTAYVGNTPYMGGGSYVPEPLLAMRAPMAIGTAYSAPYGLDPMVAASPYMGSVMNQPLFDPLYDADPVYAELANLNVPSGLPGMPGSVRMRRMSTPALQPIDSVIF